MQKSNSFQVTTVDNNKLIVQNPSIGLEVKLATTHKGAAHQGAFGNFNVDTISIEIDITKQTNVTHNEAVLVVSRKTCNYVQIVDENGNKLGAIDLGFGEALSFVYPYVTEMREHIGLFCRDCGKVVRDSTFNRQCNSSLFGNIVETLCKTCHERQ